MRGFKVILFYFIYRFGGFLVIFGVFFLRVFGHFRGFESVLVIFRDLEGILIILEISNVFWSFKKFWGVLWSFWRFLGYFGHLLCILVILAVSRIF